MQTNLRRGLLAGAAALAVAVFAARGLRAPARAAPRVFRWPAMGTVAQLVVRGGGGERLRPAVQGVYERLDSLLSAWNPASELSRLSAAGCTNWLAAVSPEVRPCYAAALRLADESGGAFNPRVGKALRALGVADGGAYAAFDLGAIAKGFAVDVAAQAVRRACAPGDPPALLLDLGGNLRVVGEGTWRTGIRNPFDKEGPLVGVLALTNGESVATSGNYERFIERDGVRLSHILDGRTGAPAHGIAAVTVVTPREDGALLADGLSTTLFVLGPDAGARLLARRHPRAAALWIPDTPAAPRILATREMARRLADARWPLRTVDAPADGARQRANFATR